MQHEYKKGRHFWRVQSDDRGKFDEIVVRTGNAPKAQQPRSGLILHAEMVSDRDCFIDVAGLCLWVHVGKDGIARITYAEDRRTDECQERPDLHG